MCHTREGLKVIERGRESSSLDLNKGRNEVKEMKMIKIDR